MKDYIYLIVPFSALILAQIYKFVTESIDAKDLKWNRLFDGYGGMPSSHTTFTSSLASTILFVDGPQTPVFALSLIFALITASDAINIRGEVSKQAIMLNKIGKLVYKNKQKELEEEIGHTRNEVIVGAIFGILYAYLMVSVII
jgi:acid phosphatase family membrane protein YuiD